MHTADVHTLETCIPQDVLEYTIRVWLLALHRPLRCTRSKVYPNGRASAVLFRDSVRVQASDLTGECAHVISCISTDVPRLLLELIWCVVSTPVAHFDMHA